MNNFQPSSQLVTQLEAARARIAQLESQLAQAQKARTTDAERWFNAFMDHTPVAAWIKDDASHYVFVNRKHEEMFKHGKETLIGKTDYFHHSPEVAEQLQRNDRTVLETNQVLQTVENVPTPDGRTPFWLVCKFPLEMASGTRYVGGVALDVTEQKHAQAELEEADRRNRLLLQELDHRVGNNLASLAGLIDISERAAASVAEFAASIRSRVKAMSTVHQLLSRGKWSQLLLGDLIGSLIPADLRQRVRVSGPDVHVLSQQSSALGMVLQELVVNSLKHGALGPSRGTVQISWRVGQKVPGTLALSLSWREHAAEAIKAPTQERVGTALIRGLVQSELRGKVTMTYPPDGAQHNLELNILQASLQDPTSTSI